MAAGGHLDNASDAAPRERFVESYTTRYGNATSAGQNATEEKRLHYQYKIRNNAGTGGVSYDILKF